MSGAASALLALASVGLMTWVVHRFAWRRGFDAGVSHATTDVRIAALRTLRTFQRQPRDARTGRFMAKGKVG